MSLEDLHVSADRLSPDAVARLALIAGVVDIPTGPVATGALHEGRTSSDYLNHHDSSAAAGPALVAGVVDVAPRSVAPCAPEDVPGVAQLLDNDDCN